MKKLIALMMVILLVFPTSVLADGAIWRYYDNRLIPLEENEQRAVINYQNGIEKMSIYKDHSVNLFKTVRILSLFNFIPSFCPCCLHLQNLT